MSTTPGPTDATVDSCLRLGHGFREEERPGIVELLAKIDHHLVGQPAEVVHLDLSAKDRHTAQQQVTLECVVAGLPTIVGTVHDRDLKAALAHVRDQVIRQFEDVRSRREPHHRS